MRPHFVTEDDIARWQKNLDEDPDLPSELIKNDLIKEVCYAGLWLCEELDKLGCPPEIMTRIQYTAGGASFGRDPWEVHQHFVNGYKNNQLEFEAEPNNLN